MKSYTKLMLAVLVAVLVLSACAQDRLPAVYATVNGVEITRERFEFHLSLLRLQTSDLQFTKEEKLEILDNLIDEEILHQEALRQEITLDEEQVQKDFAIFRKNMVSFFGSETAYIARLQEVAITEAQLKGLIGNYQLINGLIKAEQEKAVQPTEDDIKFFYDTHKDQYFKHGERREVRHILINDKSFPDAGDDDDLDVLSEELAEQLYLRLQNGESFVELAKEYSQDISAALGGKIGFIEKGDPYIVAQFREEAFKLDLNEISEPVETMFGWHILQVIEIQAPGHHPLDAETASSIKEHLYEQRRDKLRDDLIKNLTDSAEVVRKFK